MHQVNPELNSQGQIVQDPEIKYDMPHMNCPTSKVGAFSLWEY